MRTVFASCVLAWLVAAPMAHADPVVAGAGSAAATEDSLLATIPEKARLLADRGRQLQREGKFGDALEAYKAAYVLAPSPGLLFNLAQAYRLNGDCDDAAWMYRRFLETEPREDLRELAISHMQKLSSCSHQGFQAPQPDLNGMPSTKRAKAQANLQPAGSSVVISDDDRGSTKRKVGVGLMIGGGVLVATAVGFAIDGHLAANDVSDAYKGGVRDPNVHALDDRGQRDETISWVTGVTGGAALISGAVLYSLGRHTDHVAIVPHANGGEVRLAWQF